MGPIQCSAPGCQGLVQITDPEHRHSGNHYFCDYECEKKYDDWNASATTASSDLPVQVPDDEDEVFFLTAEPSDRDPTPEEEQARWDEIEKERMLNFIHELSATAHIESD